MKASKTKYLIIAALVLFAVFQVGTRVLSFSPSDRQHAGGDLGLRRNEILCAHKGVNSFRIWNRETTLQGFAPYPRPDKEKVVYHKGDLTVHVYPPWHTAFFWFYGWLTKDVCLSLMSVVFGFCLCFICYEGVRLAKNRFKPYEIVAGFALAFIAYDVTHCFQWINYGVLNLAMLLLMNKSLEKQHNILAGFAWAIMMIKPQVGLLFFWPLFWHKRYHTIVTAVITCLVATTFTAFAVNESIIDLILQIPKIGTPYATGTLLLFRPVLGSTATFAIPALFFVFVGVATWLLRKNRDFLVSCVPVVLSIPLWTYSLGHDRVILFPFYILLAGRVFALRKFDWLTIFWGVFCLSIIVVDISTALMSVVANASVRYAYNWVYRAAKGIYFSLMFVMAGLFVYEKHKELRAAGGEACKAC